MVLVAQQVFGASRALMEVARSMDPGFLRALAFVMTDVLRAAFLAGFGCLIIGALRNRRWAKEAAAAPQPPAP